MPRNFATLGYAWGITPASEPHVLLPFKACGSHTIDFYQYRKVLIYGTLSTHITFFVDYLLEVKTPSYAEVNGVSCTAL